LALRFSPEKSFFRTLLGRFGDFFVMYEMTSDSSKAGKLIVVRTDKFENLVLIPVEQESTKK
jgi:hypothetical protein